ncbi:MAG: energy transducer TonB [Thermomonas sp.]
MRKDSVWGVGMLAVVLCIQPVHAQTPPAAPAFASLHFKADVRADGVPINIQPDPALAPALQAMVRRRVAEWRYEVGQWQGKPVPMPISQQIVAEVVAVSSDDFELKIQKVTSAAMQGVAGAAGLDKDTMDPPEYPQQARKHGVSGTLIYAMHVAADGKPYDLELLAPDRLSGDMKSLARAAKTALMKWKLSAPEVDGATLDCRVVIPIAFKLGPQQPEWENPDVAPYRARLADACPASPALLTKVVGSVL